MAESGSICRKFSYFSLRKCPPNSTICCCACWTSTDIPTPEYPEIVTIPDGFSGLVDIRLESSKVTDMCPSRP
eukprot:14167087-Ditylum_brightwellii.AAC.1